MINNVTDQSNENTEIPFQNLTEMNDVSFEISFFES